MKLSLQNRIHQKPFFRKMNFYERIKSQASFNGKAQAQEMFNLLSRQQFSGCSFVSSTPCIAIKPTAEEILQAFQWLEEEAHTFFEKLTNFYPTLKPISAEDLEKHNKVIAAKSMVTLYDDLYYVSSVVLLGKNVDGTWKIINEQESYLNNVTNKSSHVFSKYPESIQISFCGSFGDVNYVDQKDFQYSTDLFYTF